MVTPKVKHEIEAFLRDHLYDYEMETGQGSRVDPQRLAELVYEWAIIQGFKLGYDDAKQEVKEKLRGICND